MNKNLCARNKVIAHKLVKIDIKVYEIRARRNKLAIFIKFLLKRVAFIVLVIASIFLAILLWHKLQYPTTVREAVFQWNLNSFLQSDAEQTTASALMPGDWELVCESNGYDAPLHLPKYEKTFPPVGAMRDGSWGIIFIENTASFRSASGSCKLGSYIDFPTDRCIQRSEAIIKKTNESREESCRKLIIIRELGSTKS